MTLLLQESLDRTLLLMRDELRQEVSDTELIAALTGTEVVLTGTPENLASHAAQSAFVAAALLMARSGHRVYLVAPDLVLAGHQPPLLEGALIASLLELGRDLLPGIEFSSRSPTHVVDLCVAIGNSPLCPARHAISINATAWSGYLSQPAAASLWRERSWPLGGLVAGTLAAGEAFKISMLKLRSFARAPQNFRKLFALTRSIRFDLAQADVPKRIDLNEVDLISGGAITSAVLFCLLRMPSITGTARIIEATDSDHSNLNRYSLLRLSQVSEPKANTLLGFATPDLKLRSVSALYDENSAKRLAPLARRVVVGVDHIPSRWLVQRMQPYWLGIGATTHWNAMASFHGRDLPCARCLHPRDDDNNARIPTVAFVSFWSGLLLAGYLARHAAGQPLTVREQHIFLTPLRPESTWWGPVGRRPQCPICGVELNVA